MTGKSKKYFSHCFFLHSIIFGQVTSCRHCTKVVSLADECGICLCTFAKSVVKWKVKCSTLENFTVDQVDSKARAEKHRCPFLSKINDRAIVTSSPIGK